MKKIFIAALAIISMVACVNEDVVEMTQSRAITFDNTFVGNATRAAADPSTTSESISGFNVWCFMDRPEGTVFTGEQVERAGDAWTYVNTQYWTPEHRYYFGALSPIGSSNWSLDTSNANIYGAGTLTFTNFDGSEDLLYSATMVQTPAMEELAAGMPAVKLTFNHLLSKVKFTFTNGFATSNSFVEIKNIKMSAPKNGTIDLAVENWWDNNDWMVDGSFDLEFGDVAKLNPLAKAECTNERMTFPINKEYEYNITFDMILYTGERVALELEKTAAVSGVALEMGKAYNFKAEINPENLHLPSIEFDVEEVKEWNQEPTQHLPGYQVDMKITNEFDFEAALAAKWPKITLGSNIVLTSNATKVIGDLVLDLNGYEITTERNVVSGANASQISALYVDGVDMTVIGTGAIKNVGQVAGYAITVDNGAEVTIKGNITVGSYYDAYYVKTGTLAIENGFHYASEYSSPKIDSEGCHASTVINCHDDSAGTIRLTGGTFVNMDPSNVHDWRLHHRSFVADGYTVVSEPQQDGSIWYTVISK